MSVPVSLCCASLLALLALVGCSDQAQAPKSAPAKTASKPAESTAKAQEKQDAGAPKPAEPKPAEPKPAEPKPVEPAKPAEPPTSGAKLESAGKTLLDPKSAELTQTAPATFKAKFVTTKGEFVIQVNRAWAPKGADRFYNLVSNGFFDGVRFFRVVADFMVQFGIHGDPKVSAAWRGATIPDDDVVMSNRRGFVSYAMAGPGTRTTQLFINLVDNTRLDQMKFAPFGQVVEGMDVVDQIYAGYGDGPPQGAGPNQSELQKSGNAYLDANFPKLDSIGTAIIVKEKE